MLKFGLQKCIKLSVDQGKAESRGQGDLKAVKGRRYKWMLFALLIVGTSTIIYDSFFSLFTFALFGDKSCLGKGFRYD